MDSLQLSPVNEKESEVFHSVKNVVKLDTVIRQSEDNLLLKVFELLRSDILNRTSTALTYLAKNKNGIHNDIGYKVLNTTEYKLELLNYFGDGHFFDNLDYVRATSYTNIMTSTWNDYIRNNLFDSPKDSITIQDLVTSYKTIVDDNNNSILTNSEDYIISDIRPHVNEYKLKVNCVCLKSTFNMKETQMLQIIEHRDFETLKRYKDILSTLRDRALTGSGRGRWLPFFNFKNTILSMVDVDISGHKLTRELDYGYTLTTHKLQGSTFDNIFVDGDDICNPINKWGTKKPNDINTRNRLLYVALSRAKYKAFIKF